MQPDSGGYPLEVIIGELPGYVNPDGSVFQYPVLHEIHFTPTAAVPPQITSQPVLSVVAGSQYSYTISATGMPAPQIGAGGLPAWLTLTGDTLEGTPQAGDLGTHGPITVTATNSLGQDDQVFSVDVMPAPAAPQITSTPPAEVTVGATYTYNIAATGVPTPTLSVTGLPAWLNFSGTTISGAPSAGDIGSSAPITATATNSQGSDDQVFSIEVKAVRIGGSSGNGGDGCIAGSGAAQLALLIFALVAFGRRRRQSLASG